MAKKKNVTKTIETKDIYFFEGDLDYLIEKLQKYRKQFKKYTRIHVEHDTEWDYQSENHVFRFKGIRPETDAEHRKRIEKHRNRKAAAKKRAETIKQKKEDKEKAEYLRLKEKYEEK